LQLLSFVMCLQHACERRRASRRCAPSATAAHGALARVLAAYDQRAGLVRKLVSAAESAADATARHERELAAALRERDAAHAGFRRQGHSVEHLKQAGKVCMRTHSVSYCQCECYCT
jgi:hypothetical protein